MQRFSSLAGHIRPKKFFILPRIPRPCSVNGVIKGGRTCTIGFRFHDDDSQTSNAHPDNTYGPFMNIRRDVFDVFPGRTSRELVWEHRSRARTSTSGFSNRFRSSKQKPVTYDYCYSYVSSVQHFAYGRHVPRPFVSLHGVGNTHTHCLERPSAIYLGRRVAVVLSFHANRNDHAIHVGGNNMTGPTVRQCT